MAITERLVSVPVLVAETYADLAALIAGRSSIPNGTLGYALDTENTYRVEGGSLDADFTGEVDAAASDGAWIGGTWIVLDTGGAGTPGAVGPAGAVVPASTEEDPEPWMIPGPSGQTGPQGAPGSTGPQGNAGPYLLAEEAEEGAPGPPGPAGVAGAAGDAGGTGATGPQGNQGPFLPTPEDVYEPIVVPGPQGPTGATGSQGAAGSGGGMAMPFGIDQAETDNEGAPLGPTTPRSFSIYFPDMPPIAPNAADDEFNDGAVSGAWTDWDVGGDTTITEGNHGLRISNSNTGSIAWSGLIKAVPSTPWSATAKFQFSQAGGASHSFGIVIGDDLLANPSTSDIVVHEIQAASTRVALWNQWNSFNSQYVARALQAAYNTFIYLRITTTDNNKFYFYHSWDGIAWFWTLSQTLPFTADSVGLASNPETTPNLVTYNRFFRVTSFAGTDTDWDSPLLGGYGRVMY